MSGLTHPHSYHAVVAADVADRNDSCGVTSCQLQAVVLITLPASWGLQGKVQEIFKPKK